MLDGFNEVCNMFGYTETYKGERVSQWEWEMGMPSISIYARELIADYGVKNWSVWVLLVHWTRMLTFVEFVLAQAAATNSNIRTIGHNTISQIASFDFW